MVFFRVYPSKEVLRDALLAGLSQGMNDWDQLPGPSHRNRCAKGQRADTRRPCPFSRWVPIAKDVPAAWMWQMLNGDYSDSEEEEVSRQEERCQQGPCPRDRVRPQTTEGRCPCSVKRKPSRSASNAPPTKKKEEKNIDEESPRFNFTGKKVTEKTQQEKTETKKPVEEQDVEVLFFKPSPWRHVVDVGYDFGPEDIKVYVRDARIRVEGRRERNVGDNDDIIECLEVNRELTPPSDVLLDDLSVFYRSGGRLELEAPRGVQRPSQQPELVRDLQKMSVEDIEKDAVTESITEHAEPKPHEIAKDNGNDLVDESTEDETTSGKPEDIQTSCGVEVESCDNHEQHADDWEILPEQVHFDVDEIRDNKSMVENVDEENNEQDKPEGEHIGEKLAEATEDEQKIEKREENQENNVIISEIEEITTKPIVEEPVETSNMSKTEQSSNNKLMVRIVSEDQQQTQIDENTQILVMNLTGFEPRDVTVKLEDDKVEVRAVRETEEEGFLSRKESFRSFRVPDRISTSDLTCTLGPEAKLVITAPATSQ